MANTLPGFRLDGSGTLSYVWNKLQREVTAMTVYVYYKSTHGFKKYKVASHNLDLVGCKLDSTLNTHLSSKKFGRSLEIKRFVAKC